MSDTTNPAPAPSAPVGPSVEPTEMKAKARQWWLTIKQHEFGVQQIEAWRTEPTQSERSCWDETVMVVPVSQFIDDAYVDDKSVDGEVEQIAQEVERIVFVFNVGDGRRQAVRDLAARIRGLAARPAPAPVGGGETVDATMFWEVVNERNAALGELTALRENAPPVPVGVEEIHAVLLTEHPRFARHLTFDERDQIVRRVLGFAARPAVAPPSDQFKAHVVRVIGDAMEELKMVRDSSAGSMFEQFANHSIWLRKLIGDAPEGSHPEEWLPRHTTWHGERANWIGEVERLRAHIKQLGSVVPADGAPSRTAVQTALMDAIEKGFLSAEVQYKSDIPSEYIVIDYSGIVGKIMESLYALLGPAGGAANANQPSAAREKFDAIMAAIPPECCVHGVPHVRAEACAECTASAESDPLFVLAFCEGAIRDAIGLEDGLDGAAGEGVLAMIRNARARVPANEPDYRDALVKVMAHTGRTGINGHTHDLTLANGLLDSIARIASAALSGGVPANGAGETNRD